MAHRRGWRGVAGEGGIRGGRPVAVVLGLLALGAGACGATRVVTRPVATTPAAPSTQPATTAPTQPAAVGSTLALAVPGGGSIAVALQAVVDPAQSANEFLSPPVGTRLVGARLRITNTGPGTYDDNANNATTAISGSEQTYIASFSPLAGCTNFASGRVTLAPGASSVGCVAFQVPTAESVVRVDYRPASGFSGQVGQWRVQATTPPTTAAATADPASVVRAYVAAINARDYRTAWALGGKNLIGGSYASFVAGFADTASDTVTILGTRGDTVDIALVATHTDGTVTTYAGSYTVAGGELVSANVHRT